MKNKFFIIDLHEDIALNVIYDTHKDISKKYSLYKGYNEYGFPVHNNVDIPRLKKGGVKFVFTSIFSLDKKSVNELNKITNQGYDFSKLKKIKTGLEGAIEQFAYYHGISEKLSHILKIVKTKNDYLSVKKSRDKVGFILHSEGIDYFTDENSVEIFYNLGLRSLALTWRNRNKFGGGNNAKGGITDLGKAVLDKCQKLGIIIDLAHANTQTFSEVIDYIKKPLIVSHTNCYAIQQHNRNLTDEQIKKVAEKGGVIGISVIYDQIGGITLNDYIKHFVHIKKLVGIDHIAFGTDFDGLIDPDIIFLKNFEDVSKFGNVIKELEKSGFKESEIEKICYKNVERIILEYLN